MNGHINGTSVSMLVDSGAIVNLLPYWLYKKFRRLELIKAKMMISDVGEGNPFLAKGVDSI